MPDPRQINFSKEFTDIPIDKRFLNEQTITRSDITQSFEEARENMDLEFSFGNNQEAKHDIENVNKEFESWFDDMKINLKRSNSRDDSSWLSISMQEKKSNSSSLNINIDLDQRPKVKPVLSPFKLKPISPCSSVYVESNNTSFWESTEKDSNNAFWLRLMDDWDKKNVILSDSKRVIFDYAYVDKDGTILEKDQEPSI